MKQILFITAISLLTLKAPAQNTGIGTSTPQATLDVKGNQRIGGVNKFMTFDSVSGKIEWRNSNLYMPSSQYLFQHSAAQDGLYYNNNAPISGQLEYRNAAGNPVFFTNFINGNGYFSGNVGIGTTTPPFPLSFGTALGDKVSLWSNSTNSYGFGIQSSLLQIHTDISAADIAFGYGSSAAFNETMRIKGNGNVGIGVTVPLARLHVRDSSVLFSATGDIPASPGNVPVSGSGRRMMWYADKAAFRAGYISGTQWDQGNIGNYSFATGTNAIASGNHSTSMGYITTASGDYSTSMGYITTASGNGSTAMGANNYASGNSSTAMGAGSIASGDVSIAMGLETTAKANGSLSAGRYNDNSDNPDPNISFHNDRIFQIGNGFNFSSRSNALTILRNGNTGIGTVNPGTRLHIVQGPSGYTGGNFPGMVLEGNSNLYFNLLSPNNSETAIMFGKASDAASGGIVYNNTAHLNGMEFRTNGNATRMVLIDNGNLGIGNNVPAVKLHVSNGSSGNTSPLSPFAVESNTNTYINVLSPNANETGILFGKADNAASGGIVYNSNSLPSMPNGFQFRVNGNQTVASLNSAGNWGMGEPPTQSRLTIGQTPANDYALWLYKINGAGNGEYHWQLKIGPLGANHLYFTANNTDISYIDNVTGNYVAISDKNYKKDIQTLPPVLSKMMRLNPVSYRMKEQVTDEAAFGFIAQELQQVFPDAVKKFEKDGKLGISYTHLIPLTVAALQEQQKMIEKQQQQIDELKKMVEKLLKQ
jgi:hypothetical protein